jgi:hypothetical protein
MLDILHHFSPCPTTHPMCTQALSLVLTVNK